MDTLLHPKNASHTYRAGGISESPGEVAHSGIIVQYSGLEIGLTNLEKFPYRFLWLWLRVLSIAGS